MLKQYIVPGRKLFLVAWDNGGYFLGKIYWFSLGQYIVLAWDNRLF
jgi:hypothetical protein